MMRVEILGTGCYGCIHLERLVHEVLRESGRTDVQVIRINDERKIRKFMPPGEAPGLIIDGWLVTTQVVPEREELASWLAESR